MTADSRPLNDLLDQLEGAWSGLRAKEWGITGGGTLNIREARVLSEFMDGILFARLVAVSHAAEDAASNPCEHGNGRCSTCNYDYCEPEAADGPRCVACDLRARLASLRDALSLALEEEAR